VALWPPPDPQRVRVVTEQTRWARRERRAVDVAIALAALGQAAGFVAIDLPTVLTAVPLATAAYCLAGAIRASAA
jgi:hypothetical protein